MKIRIEFTNTDKANVINHARDLDIEEGFAEKFEEVANNSAKTTLKQASFEYNAEENFFEINVSQILMNKIAEFVSKICKQFKPMMAVVKAFVSSVEDDLEEIAEEANSDHSEAEPQQEGNNESIKTEFDC